MDNSGVDYVLSVSPREASDGIKTIITIHGRRLELSIPAGVKTGTIMKLHNVGNAGDIVSVQIRVVTPAVPDYSRSRFPAWGKPALWLGGIAVLVVIGLFSSNTTKNPNYIYNNAIAVRADGQPIELINNPKATDPTYAELVSFIKADTTDQLTYVDGVRVCADFAESVHNNAEARGIKAAWVGINFTDGGQGHAVDAFETTDRGLVFVDCTGGKDPGASDKIAYLEKGKVLGFILLDYADSVSYSFYEYYAQDWQKLTELQRAYNTDVSRYNLEIKGKKYVNGSTAWKQIQAWKSRLVAQEKVIDKLSVELGKTSLKPMGIVSNIFIRW